MSIHINLHHFQEMLKSNQASSTCNVMCIEVMHLLFRQLSYRCRILENCEMGTNELMTLCTSCLACILRGMRAHH